MSGATITVDKDTAQRHIVCARPRLLDMEHHRITFPQEDMENINMVMDKLMVQIMTTTDLQAMITATQAREVMLAQILLALQVIQVHRLLVRVILAERLAIIMALLIPKVMARR